jgi:methyl-accepting chemotaxis protein
LRLVSIVSLVVIAVVIIALALGLRRIVLVPLVALRNQMTEIASGRAERTARIAVRGQDEIAAVGTAFNTMLDTLAGQDHELAEANADRERHLAETFERQHQAEQQVRTRAQQVIDSTVETVSSDLAEVSGRVEVVRRAAETIDQRVSTADTATRSVVGKAAHATQVVTDLQTSLRQISGMAELIANVADQTKLLALNATIEAARAGEAGHGFSVVANEVKDLAMTTARSTGQITDTIETLLDHARAVETAIGEMRRGIEGVDDATAAVHQVAQEQFTVVADLDQRVHDTAARVVEMSSLTQRLERREAERAATSGPVRLLFSGTTTDAELLNVSSTGVGVRSKSSTTLTPGQPGQVEFDVPGGRRTVDVVVASHRVGAAGTEAGLKFRDPAGAAVADVLRATARSAVRT